MLVLLAAAAGVATVGIWLRMLTRPEAILYALAFVVSFVGVNWHVGITLYFSRLLLGAFLSVVLVRQVLLRRAEPRLRCDRRILALFASTVIIGVVSAVASDRRDESLRQVFIYIGAMLVFVTVVSLADTSAKVVRALQFYVAAGIVQGIYGIYQVIGGPRAWPTYQTLLAAVPTANDRTDGGFYFTPGYNVFRAIGFFPGDVSHYAGYLPGVLLIALAFLAYGRRSRLLLVAVATDVAGLLLSLSRSGIVAFAGIGLPVLALLLSSRGMLSMQRLVALASKAAATVALLLALAVGVFGRQLLEMMDVARIGDVLVARLSNLIMPGDSPAFESMALHIETRMLALDAARTSPLIGVGLGVTAKEWYSERYNVGWRGAHSHHFNILGETGILGAAAEWMFMALVLRKMLRGVRQTPPRSQEQAAMVGLLAAYTTILVGNFFYAYYTNDFVWFLMGAGWALSVAASREARQREHMQAGAQTPDRRAVAC